jgi:hypothetical protein
MAPTMVKSLVNTYKGLKHEYCGRGGRFLIRLVNTYKGLKQLKEGDYAELEIWFGEYL